MCSCGEEVKDARYEMLESILDNYRETTGKLIPVLQETQEIFGYLPQDAIREISRVLRIPASEIYGVATFYGQFHLKPRGKNIIKICTGTACHVRGGGKVLEALRESLGLKDGVNTTDDLQFTLDPVACLGACGMAPVMMVNDDVYGRLEPKDVAIILERYKTEETEEKGGQGCVA
ncbi:MAG: NADH-quinone oxidoreductase subunit NuoE [Bacillota bacterium]|nr:NADH-quinone oxidoreductase subunit NuoE [Bacillota bacterium]